MIRDVSKANKNEVKEQKDVFGTLGASLLANYSTSKSPIRADEETIRGSHGL